MSALSTRNRSPLTRKARFGAALLGSTMLFPATAAAQVGASPIPPPVFSTVDEHGVDIISGRVRRTVASVDIGPGGPGSLSYRWGIDETFNEQQDIYGYITVSGTRTTVTIGGASGTFTLASGTYTSDQANGSTLVAGTGTLTYTSSNGMVAVFSTALVSGSPASNLYKITSLTYPTGEVLTYYYVYHPLTVGSTTTPVYDVQAVTSNLGYQLRIGYLSDPSNATKKYVASVTGFNMANETCDPAAASCTLTGTWPSLSYDLSTGVLTDASGHSVTISKTGTTTTITRPSGGAETYTFSSRVTAYTDGKGTWQYLTPGGPMNPNVFVRLVPGAQVGEIYQLDNTTGRLYYQETNAVRSVYSYDSNARLTQIVTFPVSGSASAALTHQYSYDTRGNVTQTKVISITPGTPADIVTSASYPSSCSNVKTCNQPDYTIDANGNRTDYTYDSTHGSVLTVTSPAATTGAVRPQKRYGYTSLSANYKNGAGTVIAGPALYRMTSVSQCTTTASCAGTADEVKTTISYGANDALLPVSATTGAGDGSLTATTATTYYPTGDVKAVDGPLSGSADSTRVYYDAQRRKTGVIGPDPDGAGALLYRAQRTTYNNDGGVSLVEAGTATSQSDTAMSSFSALQATAIDYDAQGRVYKQRGLIGGSTATLTQYSYIDSGKPECVAVRTNPSTFASPPSWACTAATPGSYGSDQITQTGYDTQLRPVSTTQGVGSGAPATVLTTAYTDLNQVASVTDGENNKTSYDYDGMGRLYKTRYPDTTKGSNTSSTTDYEQLSFDPTGHVLSERLRDGTTISLGYDALGRLTSKDLPGSEPDVSYAYDLLGHMTAAVDGGSNYTGFAYDALGRMTHQSSPLGVIGIGYDLAGRRAFLIWPDNFYVTYDRLVSGEVTAIREGGVTALATYAYDDLGRRTSLTLGNGTVTNYGFDGLSRLSSLALNLDGSTTTNDVTTSFGYSPASQIATQTRTNDLYFWDGHYNVGRAYVANGRNQYTAVGTATPGYDSRGNVTSVAGSLGTDSYGYSSENLLTSATVFTAPGVSIGTTYAYDPMLRLYQETGSAITRFMYDGNDMIGETNSSNVLQKRYVFGPGTDEPLVEYAGSGTGSGVRTYLHADERGSIVARSNESGAKTAINSYDEYGIPYSANTGRFQYTGQAWFARLGMYYYKARVYSPSLGRFMQTDPIGYRGGMNLYNYAYSDPINGRDTLGLCDQPIKLYWSHTVISSNGQIVEHKDTFIGNICLEKIVGPDQYSLDAAYRLAQLGPLGEMAVPCESLLNEPGRIVTRSGDASLTLVLGLAGSRGTWRNLQTGSHGVYTTAGFSVGLSFGGHGAAMIFDNLKALNGLSDGVSIGGGFSIPGTPIGVSASYNHSSNDDGVGDGFSAGPGMGPSLSLAVTQTTTDLSQCYKGASR